jgi:hypothetical protein
MPRPTPGQDPAEFQIARQFIQYIRVAKNVYLSALMYGKLRKKTSDWALDPAFVAHNADFSLWSREVPDDMQIVYPPDNSPPWIQSHYIANLHSYQCLAIIMPSSAPCCVGLFRRNLEATHGYLLHGSEEHVQTPGGDTENLWHARAALYVERHELYHLRNPHLHHAAPGKSSPCDNLEVH